MFSYRKLILCLKIPLNMTKKSPQNTPKKVPSGAKIFIQFCLSEGLVAPIPEYVFAADIRRSWRIDFFFSQSGVQVGLEVEGGVWQGGRHNRASGFLKDMEKYNSMSCHGIFLIRVVPKDLLTMDTVRLIKKVLNKNKI